MRFCEYQTTIGFMSTKIVTRCQKLAEPGRSYCAEHEASLRSKHAHSVWPQSYPEPGEYHHPEPEDEE